MVRSRVWEHLSSWLSLNLTCITSVIRSELNEKYYFASDICTKSHSVNRLCFSFTLPSSQFLFFFALPSFPPFVIFFSPHLYHVFPPFLCPRKPIHPISAPGFSSLQSVLPPPCFLLTLAPPPRRSWTAVRLRWCYNISAPSLSTSWPCLPCMQTKRAKL